MLLTYINLRLFLKSSLSFKYNIFFTVEGMTQAKINKFGLQLVNHIEQFCHNHTQLKNDTKDVKKVIKFFMSFTCVLSMEFFVISFVFMLMLYSLFYPFLGFKCSRYE